MIEPTYEITVCSSYEKELAWILDLSRIMLEGSLKHTSRALINLFCAVNLALDTPLSEASDDHYFSVLEDVAERSQRWQEIACYARNLADLIDSRLAEIAAEDERLRKEGDGE